MVDERRMTFADFVPAVVLIWVDDANDAIFELKSPPVVICVPIPGFPGFSLRRDAG